MPLYPFLLNPALHVKVWGGRQLQTVVNKSLPTDEPYGESWEMHDTAVITNGELAGKTLAEVLQEFGHEVVGDANNPDEGMPLLAKFLDAQEWLSVQNHPSDEQARQLEDQPRGKCEAWYVLKADPGARIVIGVQPGTTREAMAQAIRENRLEDLIIYAEVKAGDVLLNTPGTIHALGPGIVIYEIQQSSDTTYRLYDWGRIDLNGQPRTLHIDKGVAVANLDTLPQIKHTDGNTLPVVDVVTCEYFTTLLHQLNPRNGPRITLDTEGEKFHILTCIEGQAAVGTDDTQIILKTGQTALIPASVGAYTLSGTARVLRSFQ
jgi:mannose-6-phosphate isomerase